MKQRTSTLLILPIVLLTLLSQGARADKAEPDQLRVLVWNVWHGTNDVDNGPEKALQLIKDSKADVCLLQESYDINGPRPNFGPWAAKELGWHSYQGNSPHLCIVSRFPIKKTFIQAPWHAVGAELTDNKGRTLHVFSTWIDYRSGVASYLRKNPSASDEDILSCETKRSSRLKQANNILSYLEKQSLHKLTTPLLVGGDWNCPSHLDWTTATAKAFPHRRPLPLPVSLAMHKAGYSDTYRKVHPDPVKYPGNTWSPLFRTHEGKPLPMNRIDRLYYKSNRPQPLLKPVRAIVYPEKLEDDAVPTRQRKFPSDHAAVLIEFEWLSQKTDK